MFTPNYYADVQSPYFDPRMSFTQPPPQIPRGVDMNTPNNGSGIIWVQGEAAAKAYPVLKNNIVALWDSENQTIYIKSTDESGRPTMRILDWTERQVRKNVLENIENGNANANVENNDVKYVTREEFDDVVRRLNNISNKIGNNKQKPNNSNNNGKDKEENNNG